MASHGLPRVQREVDAEKERRLINDYRELVDLVSVKVQDKQYNLETLALTSRLLKKNPEYYTVWNHRRHILSALLTAAPLPPTSEADNDDDDAPTTTAAPTTPPAPRPLDLITSDLTFLIPLLKEFPKCYWIWNYRLWLLETGSRLLPPSEAQPLWQAEQDLVSLMLSRDERNFHGWGYRRRVVAEVEGFIRQTSGEERALVESEFAYTTAMVKRALANFSALHYRSTLIPALLEKRRADGGERRGMLQGELDLMQNALVDPFNQSAWFYHQYLMNAVRTDIKEGDAGIVLDLSVDEKKEIYEQEIERIEEMLEDIDDCKWIYQALIEYTREYQALGGEAAEGDKLQRWLQDLQRLDPARSGRWTDLQSSLKL